MCVLHCLNASYMEKERRDSRLGFDQFEAQNAAMMIRRLKEPRSSDAIVRVVVMRHGMGKHQDGIAGTASAFNRDAELNEVGLEQASRSGFLLRDAGFFPKNDSRKLLVFVSPMKRTLQTAIRVFGSDSWPYLTIVEPLAGEVKPVVLLRGTARKLAKTSGAASMLAATQQGDKGSSPAVLNKKFPSSSHPQFREFSTVQEYCAQRGTRWGPGGKQAGKWYHHGHKSGNEMNRADALKRAKSLRIKMVSEAQQNSIDTVLLVSHGGMLKLAFEQEAEPSFQNGEFRVFDLSFDGELVQRTETNSEL